MQFGFFRWSGCAELWLTVPQEGHIRVLILALLVARHFSFVDALKNAIDSPPEFAKLHFDRCAFVWDNLPLPPFPPLRGFNQFTSRVIITIIKVFTGHLLHLLNPQISCRALKRTPPLTTLLQMFPPQHPPAPVAGSVWRGAYFAVLQPVLAADVV
jgi:hypothetical protein